MRAVASFVASLGVLLAAAAPASSQDADGERYREMSLEELLQIKITTATKTAVSLREAPAALTVITRADIQRYGYRTLNEALARVPEVHSHYEGYLTAADFRGLWSYDIQRRVLYLLDGRRLNDPLHTGDFEPDVIGDLSNVERIEVIRGPGAALYGTVAVLGVVNIITRKVPANGKTSLELAVSADDLGTGSSFSQRYRAGLQHRFSKAASFSASLYWFDEGLAYDAGVEGHPAAWRSTASPEPGRASISADSALYFDLDSDFTRGPRSTLRRVPSGSLALQAGEFTLGAFLHARRASLVWPLANSTFGHPDNRRGAAAGTVYLEWKPKWTWDLVARASRQLYGVGGRLDFSNSDYILAPSGTATPLSLARRVAGAVLVVPPLVGAGGERYGVGSGVDPSFLSSPFIDSRGGGIQAFLESLSKAWNAEVEASPLKTDQLRLSLGASYVSATFENLNWNRFRDGSFHSWSTIPGAASEGSAYGIWAQAIWSPTPKLTITAGSRYDRQMASDTRLQLGGEKQLYASVGVPPNVVLAPSRVRDKVSNDFTPRVAANWSLGERSSARLIYAEAFRAVPPDEVIRLATGEAASEKTKDYEAILSHGLTDSLNVSLSAFRLDGNVLYGGNYSNATRAFQYGKGSGWSNTGGSAVVQYRGRSGIEGWLHLTLYHLRKPTDFFSFVRDYKVAGAPPLPTMHEPLDSPTFLIKAGASRRFRSDTTVAGELYYSGAATTLIPVNQNLGDPDPGDPSQPNFRLHKTPRSLTLNLNLRQDLGRWGLRGVYLTVHGRDLLDRTFGVLNQDEQQTWDANTYARPNQLPGLGRRLGIQAGYTF